MSKRKVYFWIHPESSSCGRVYSEEETERMVNSDPCVEIVPYPIYEKFKNGIDSSTTSSTTD